MPPSGCGERLYRVRVSSETCIERTTGIEPALSAWEADILPLNYIRIRDQGQAGKPSSILEGGNDLSLVPATTGGDRRIARRGLSIPVCFDLYGSLNRISPWEFVLR